MKRFNLNFVIFLLVFSAFAGKVQAETTSFEFRKQNRNTISGYVFDSQRRPVSGLYIELQNDVYSTLARIRTGGSGRFLFSNLSAGKFYIRVLTGGTNFEEQTQEVQIINFSTPRGNSSAENVQKDFYLRPRRNESEKNEISGVIFVQDVPEKAGKSYKKAVALIDNGKTDDAIIELRNALEVFPDYYAALETLGNEYTKRQNFAEAQAIYSKAVAVNPRSYAGWYGLSFTSYGLREANAAIEAGEKAVLLKPDSVEAHLILGISYRFGKLYEKAEKSFKQADKLAKGESADVHWNLALLYAHNFNRFNAAADELELYLKAAPDAENAPLVKKLIKQFREKKDDQ